MNKRERASLFVKNHQSLFACPVCHGVISTVTASGVMCENGHQIDFNRHGYLHFLNTAGDAKYGREMFEARRQILSAGLFDGIIKAVNQALPSAPQVILDAGTGEGTPLLKLANLRQQEADTLIGFDIASAGITLATQLPLKAFFCVADLRNLPFAEHSVDSIVELFSPSAYSEFNRVLKPGGRLLKIIPNSDYLKEVRTLLYPADDRHATYSNDSVLSLFQKHYPHSTVQNVRYQFAVPQSLRQQMVLMTPLHWGRHVQQPTPDQLAALDSVTVDVDLLTAIVN